MKPGGYTARFPCTYQKAFAWKLIEAVVGNQVAWVGFNSFKSFRGFRLFQKFQEFEVFEMFQEFELFQRLQGFNVTILHCYAGSCFVVPTRNDYDEGKGLQFV